MLDFTSALLDVRSNTLVNAGIALAIVAIAHVTLKWLAANRDAKPAPPAGESASDINVSQRYWFWHGIHRLVGPLAWLLWVYALQILLAEILTQLHAWSAAPVAQATLESLYGAAMLFGCAWLMQRIGQLVDEALQWWAQHSANHWDDVMAPLLGRAARMLLPIIAVIVGAPMLAIPAEVLVLLQHLVSLVLIATMAALLLQLVGLTAGTILRRYQLDVKDNHRARGVHTQVLMLRKIVMAVVILITIAAMLMVFEPVRHFGKAIIASAGVASIIIGFAAQKSLATLLAGFQIAMTQPIRIDDVVIVEGEWGQIEEITLTYVVVRLWDWRRLVLPITYFIETPFQNWTRTSSEIIGSVFLHMDYTVPLEELRTEFKRILDHSKLWDKNVAVLQVTDAKEHTMELRALVSASDASTSWDLRCEVREKLLMYLQRQHPESLPRLRVHDAGEAVSARRPAHAAG